MSTRSLFAYASSSPGVAAGILRWRRAGRCRSRRSGPTWRAACPRKTAAGRPSELAPRRRRAAASRVAARRTTAAPAAGASVAAGSHWYASLAGHKLPRASRMAPRAAPVNTSFKSSATTVRHKPVCHAMSASYAGRGLRLDHGARAAMAKICYSILSPSRGLREKGIFSRDSARALILLTPSIAQQTY